jgi:hypothetical protein
MTPRTTPRVAIWILEHAVTRPTSLAGDLIELHAAGRSRAWLWRQVLIAVVVDAVTQARQHPALTARSAIVAWIGVHYSAELAFAMRNLVVSLMVWLWGPLGAVPHGRSLWWISVVGPLFAFCAAGWVTGRMHREAHTAGALLTIVTSLGFALPLHLPRSFFGTLRMLIWSTAVLLGALLSARPGIRPGVAQARLEP